jgi:uncharacterized membrane protein
MEKSSTGMEENLAALLCYLLGFITGIIFFVVEKESEFVKFHAMQSIMAFGGLFILNIVLGFIPIIGWAIGLLLNLASVVVWIVCMIKAYQGEKFKLPVIGDLAEKQIVKASA